MSNPNIIWKGSPNFRVQTGIKKEFIVFHWIVGRLESATSIFQNASRKVATNYGVGPREIHQYVEDNYYAFGSGTTHSNKYGISIEHEGGWMQNGQRVKPTQATLDRSAELCAMLARKHNLGELIPGKNAFPHSHFVATQCPGTLDWHYICKKANEINASISAPVQSIKPPVKPVEAPKPAVLKDPSKEEWKALQRLLAASWGYKGTIDGIPGKLTWSAVQRYLKANFGYNGVIDGIAGPLTQAAWNRAGKTIKPVTPVESPKPPVLKDPNKTQWKAIQKVLKANWGYKGTIDGIPGKLTWSAVQRYLKANFGYKGIIDGIPGPLTQAAWNKAGRTVK
jgi:peptidoglycan hydrolase-like protein with peptidoglycan-binding domain